MAWIDPIDRVPQVPQDYGNHFIYGGLFSWFVVLLLSMVAPTLPMITVWLWAFAVVLMVAAVKKVVDFWKEGESLTMCLLKTVVTALLPLWVLVVYWLGQLPGQ